MADTDTTSTAPTTIDAPRQQQAQLGLVTDTLHLPTAPGVCRVGPRGLIFAPNATEADLLDVGHSLFAVRSYTKWALGSLFAEMRRKRDERREDAKAGRNDIPREVAKADDGGAWSGEFALAHHMDPKEYREVIGVVTFYAGQEHIPGLDFEHYREAMWATDDGQPGGVSRAMGYLRVARERGLKVTEMRRYIRSSSATEPSEPKQMELAAYGAVFDFMRFAKRELDEVERYTPERAALILSDLGESTLSYIDALREISSGADPRKVANARKREGTGGNGPRRAKQ